ncbi:MAG: hypothetical protein LBJ11_02970 [Oscillospiraceae bacterium]|jgi:hypothetical protein|nr:hypothetical protein [Oscillospiraceae bacterium]
MIPKIVHYCWYGGQQPHLIRKCIRSWKKQLPDWEFREWNESNTDLHGCVWAEQAMGRKRWAFVSDYVRCQALWEFGGVYLDTDVELLRPLDSFLDCPFFAGFENDQTIGSAVLGSETGHPIPETMLREYYQAADVFPEHPEPNVRPLTQAVMAYISTQKTQNMGGGGGEWRHIPLNPRCILSYGLLHEGNDENAAHRGGSSLCCVVAEPSGAPEAGTGQPHPPRLALSLASGPARISQAPSIEKGQRPEAFPGLCFLF